MSRAPQFAKATTRPLTAASYRSAVRRMRQICDQIEARAEAAEPRERASLTRAIHGLSHTARTLSRRHRGESLATEIEREMVSAE